MFGMGWSEMVLIGIVALIVVGPKDLPGMFRTLGQFTGKARGMAREFSKAMEAAADESGVKDISKTIKAASNPTAFGTDKLREAAGLKSSFKPGGATEALSAEREANRAKIAEATAAAATARKAREAAAAAGIEVPAETPPAAKPAPAAKSAAAKKAAPKADAAKATPKTPAKPAAGKASAKAASAKATPKPRAPRKPKASSSTDSSE
ncbi:MAG: Sec-independent protein translocase protein TatB [Flavimaricola sp.]|nr:Sec-independent protein translocase protein TatB [Flavimaricola sp.]